MAANFDLAPPPKVVDGLLAVPIDIASVDASFAFDGSTSSATAEAIIAYSLGPHAGNPALDLRQTTTEAWLDGVAFPAAQIAHHSFGAGPFTFVRHEPTALIFTGPNGAAVRRGNFRKLTKWGEVVAQLGLTGVHFHDLRHAGNVWAAQSGVSTRDLMATTGAPGLELPGVTSVSAGIWPVRGPAERKAERRGWGVA